jgi:hypothetical protein
MPKGEKLQRTWFRKTDQPAPTVFYEKFGLQAVTVLKNGTPYPFAEQKKLQFSN